jgi:Fe-S-cluster-containing dehydrogenase component
MTVDRRSLLKGVAAVGVGAAASSLPVEASTPRPEAPPDAVGMLYDATRCIGCRACVTACKEANAMPGNLYNPPQDLSGDTKNIIKVYDWGGPDQSFMKAQCMHCLDPACARACMIGALQKREFGIITWDGTKCIGCRYCQVACPYSIPKFQWYKAVPKIVKCELCNHRIDDETGRPKPACCEACPKEAVITGTYVELLAEARRRVAEHPEKYYPAGAPRIYGETDGGGTQVLYLAAVDFEHLGLPDLGDVPSGARAAEIQHMVYKGAIAPVALYGILGAVIWRNRRANKKGEE